MSQELTIKEICADLKISEAKFFVLLAKDKTFITYKVGGSRRMSRSDLEAWKKAQKAKPEQTLVSAA